MISSKRMSPCFGARPWREEEWFSSRACGAAAVRRAPIGCGGCGGSRRSRQASPARLRETRGTRQGRVALRRLIDRREPARRAPDVAGTRVALIDTPSARSLRLHRCVGPFVRGANWGSPRVGFDRTAARLGLRAELDRRTVSRSSAHGAWGLEGRYNSARLCHKPVEAPGLRARKRERSTVAAPPPRGAGSHGQSFSRTHPPNL